ncbi:LysE family translocator [Rouxiella badensis]|jgi:threonine/homoserine/homoserine lactone efflux protein|uniref:LysE family translocator n=1 Tax=Rouxiella badensis TaxID=1646377 RepID=UPI0017883ADA|nr:LysE family translocator [Rouxiella badensis]MCC3720217.1 LysE family translocator [Rouxiella badensis]MCC3729880.1 LysE family translocator [Rouxiella badensis]MCC3733937.1 LysE family translocator [Rouxiella badensis]MCC3741367.1 LysE family translocator [Rouxiella badensis]MCC3759451.1 LysE family translocator [Rouxiella badensis]
MLDTAFMSYVTVMSITPGPNNLLLASSGVNFGLRKTLPMTFGITLGCALQCAVLTSLLAVILSWMTVIRLPMAVIGCAYLFWLSWKIFRSSTPQNRAEDRPMRLINGALFQIINPKAWLMATNVAILFTPPGGSMLHHTLANSIGFAILNLPCVLIWALMGDRLRLALQVEWKLKAFNTLMAGLMALTALWLLFDELKNAFIH